MALKTETNTRKMGQRVAKAARKFFHTRKVGYDFEHGQWWITLMNGAQYSVVDAEGGPAVDGFDFEMVTEPQD